MWSQLGRWDVIDRLSLDALDRVEAIRACASSYGTRSWGVPAATHRRNDPPGSQKRRR